MIANQSIHLTINTVSGTSGVYIGNQNISTAISSHSKSNNAVGSLGNGTRFHRNVSIVYDPDIIDTPIDDRDVKIFAPQYNHSAAHVLNTRLDSINTGTLNQNSGLFVGETTITGFDSHEKSNYGVGPCFGNVNQSRRNINLIYDPDAIDGIMDDRDIKSGVFMSGANPSQIAR